MSTRFSPSDGYVESDGHLTAGAAADLVSLPATLLEQYSNTGAGTVWYSCLALTNVGDLEVYTGTGATKALAKAGAAPRARFAQAGGLLGLAWLQATTSVAAGTTVSAADEVVANASVVAGGNKVGDFELYSADAGLNVYYVRLRSTTAGVVDLYQGSGATRAAAKAAAVVTVRVNAAGVLSTLVGGISSAGQVVASTDLRGATLEVTGTTDLHNTAAVAAAASSDTRESYGSDGLNAATSVKYGELRTTGDATLSRSVVALGRSDTPANAKAAKEDSFAVEYAHASGQHQISVNDGAVGGTLRYGACYMQTGTGGGAVKVGLWYVDTTGNLVLQLGTGADKPTARSATGNRLLVLSGGGLETFGSLTRNGAGNVVPLGGANSGGTRQGPQVAAHTTAQRTAMAAPAAGLLAQDSDLARLMLHDGTAWVTLLGTEQYRSATLADNQVAAADVSATYAAWPYATTTGVHIRYSLLRNGQAQAGLLKIAIAPGGTAAVVDDDPPGTAALGVTFSWVAVGGTHIRLQYTTTATGFTTAMKFAIAFAV